MGLTCTVTAQTEPIDLDMVKRFCRFVNPADTEILAMIAVAAREWVEQYRSEPLCTAQFLWTMDRFINLYLYQTSLYTQQIWPWYLQSQSLIGNRLPNTWYSLWSPVGYTQSIDEIQYIDVDGNWQVLDPSLYIVDTDPIQCRITPAFGQYWPATQMRIEAVKINLTAGRKVVPAKFKLAIAQLAAHWYDNRETVGFDQPHEIPLHTLSLLGPPAGGRYMTP